MQPIVPIGMTNSPAAAAPSVGGAGDSSSELPFQSLFEDAVNNVKQTDAAANEEIYKMTTGQSDNLHDIVIASQKASLSVDLLVEMRNKVLDAYNEVMRMSV